MRLKNQLSSISSSLALNSSISLHESFIFILFNSDQQVLNIHTSYGVQYFGQYVFCLLHLIPYGVMGGFQTGTL